MKTNIRFLRKALKMTQLDLAEKVKVTRQTIIAIEKGNYNPSLVLAHKIKKALKKKFIEDVFEL